MLKSFSGEAVPKHLPSSKIFNGIEKWFRIYAK